MNIKVFQKGFHFSQDGTGNRLVYHFQGCNMKCLWCANPEGIPVEGILMTSGEWMSDQICPYGAVKEKTLDREVCKKCEGRDCLKGLYRKAIKNSCQTYSPQEILSEIKGSSPMFFSGGGVTFTGGEATIQFEALKALLIELKKEKIHTALETNGTQVRLNELFPYLDQLIMDVKHCSNEAHLHFTGAGNGTIRENIKLAGKMHPCLHIRVPFIGGVNDSPKDIDDFLAFFKEVDGSNVTFEILRYHEFGKEKWKQCGLPYEMTEQAYVSEEDCKLFRQKILENGLTYLKT